MKIFKKHHIIYFLLVLTLFASCNFKKNTNFFIKGNINGKVPSKVYLVKLNETGPQIVDSTEPDKNGKFKLMYFTEQPHFFLVKTKNTRGINLLIKPSDKIKLYINADDWDFNYIVENSPESKRIHQLIKEHNRTMIEITRLSYELEEYKDNENFLIEKKRIDSIYNIIFQRHKNFSIDFIMKDPCSFASLMALYQSLGLKVTVFKIKEDFKYFNIVDSCLSLLYPESEPVKILNQQITNYLEKSKTEIGSLLPDISLPDTSGRNFSLLNLIKNKDYSLIVFWSSWCIKCQYDLIILKNIEKNLSSTLQIIQISIEKTKKAWKTSLLMENTNWMKLSDCKYWDSEIIDIFKIFEVPYYILVDKKGTIICRDKNINSIINMFKNN